jgi:hypothetical protein
MHYSTIILPTAYHPTILYFALLHYSEKTIIDINENYYKQTYRNRTVVYSASGKLFLSVPIIMGRSLRIPVKDAQISYTEHWQHAHIKAIETAYHSTPFFNIIFPDIKHIINQNFTLLWELNDTLLKYYLSILNLNENYFYSTKYVEKDFTKKKLDLRTSYSPKKKYQNNFSFLNKPYYQTFSNQHGFIPELSVLDLIMHLGHEAGYYIRTLF